MTARIFVLPDLGEGLTEAELVRWLVAVGDEVQVDQPIAEVETAKSVVEVPSPYGGVVAALHGDEGDALIVGAPLIEVTEVSELAEVAGVSAADAAPEPAPAPAATSASAATAASGSGNVLVGYGTTDMHHAGRRNRARSTLTPAVSATSASRVVPVISPVVRTLARTHGVDLAAVTPSGQGGVITRHDVEAAVAVAVAVANANAATANAATPPAATPPAATASTASTVTAAAPTTPAPPAAAVARAPGDIDQRTGLAVAAATPFTLFRRTVAANMVRSRAEIPEATVWVDVDATDLWDARRRIRLGDRHPSLLAFIARFTLAALTRFPALAGRVTDDGAGLETFDGVNLGFAVDSPRGLVVPVVRRADRMTIRELDAELDRLTRLAREGSLAPADLTGSTFTINNYGSLGVDGSAAIINHPEVAILGVGRMIERPWVVDGGVVPRRIAQLSLVFDHRVTDGGVAAGMLRDVADAVESPLTLLADAPPAEA